MELRRVRIEKSPDREKRKLYFFSTLHPGTALVLIFYFRELLDLVRIKTLVLMSGEIPTDPLPHDMTQCEVYYYFRFNE